MKKLRFLFIALLTMAIGFATESCSKEDESLASQIIGTWRDSAYDDGSYTELTFKADGKFRQISYDGSDGYVETFEGTYSIVGEVLTLNLYEDGKFAGSYSGVLLVIDKNRISFDEIMYIRQ